MKPRTLYAILATTSMLASSGYTLYFHKSCNTSSLAKWTPTLVSRIAVLKSAYSSVANDIFTKLQRRDVRKLVFQDLQFCHFVDPGQQCIKGFRTTLKKQLCNFQ